MKKEYKNALLDVCQLNYFLWISRKIEFTKTFQQERPQISPSDFRMIVYNCFKSSAALNISKKEMKQILKEISFAYNLCIMRFLGYFTIKVLMKSMSGIFVDESQILKLKLEMGRSPVIFLPTHRSYGDFLLLGFVCWKYGVNLPVVAAGVDFQRMALMSEVLRRSKAFFMRRQFSQDTNYKALFTEYINVLVSNLDAPIEFFIEGTRSRSGKSLMPKFGLLAMLVEAFMSGKVPDLKFVPINISYDRILEEYLLARELIGIPKPKESTLGLLNGLRLMNGNYGNVFINFGDILSIREFFKGCGDLRFFPDHMQNIIIRDLAFKVIRIQQCLQTFGCFNLLALIINSNIIREKSYVIYIKDAVAQFQWLLGLYKYFGYNVFVEGQVEEAIKRSIDIHSSLVELSDHHFIRIKLWGENSNSPTSRKMSHEKYQFTYVPFIMLQIYINPSLNIFVRGSIITVILNQAKYINQIEKTLLFVKYKYLCSLLKHEFVLFDSDIKEFSDYVTHLKNLKVIKLHQHFVQLQPNTKLIDFFLDLIHPFIHGIHSICVYLKANEKKVHNKNRQDVLLLVQWDIKGQIWEGRIPHYCASTDFISNTFNSLAEMGIISMSTTNKLIIHDNIFLNRATKFLNSLINSREKIYPLNNIKIQAKL